MSVRSRSARAGQRTGRRRAAARADAGRFASALAAALLVVAGLGVAIAPATASNANGGPTWREVSSALPPPARENGTMAYDAATGQVVLFGGLDNSLKALGDTWIWNGTAWSEVTPSKSPSARFGASMAYDAATHQLVLFGGEEVWGGLDYGGQLNDTWIWTGTTWRELSPAKSPDARAYASMAYDAATHQLVLFGGEDPNSYSFFADTWSWSGTSWTEVSASTTGLGALDGTAMAYDAATSTLVLFGGSNSSGTDSNDTWTWNGTKWTQSAPAQSPPTLDGGSMDYDEATGQLVLFGGYDAGALDDTWTWSPTTWTELTPSKVPPARAYATMAYDAGADQLLLFSGWPSLDDTWIWGSAPEAPAAPVSLKATAGKDKVTLSWKPPASDGGSAVTGYDVFMGTSSGHEAGKPLNPKPLPPHARTYVATGLKKGHRYYFTAKAINAVGAGAASKQVSAVPT